MVPKKRGGASSLANRIFPRPGSTRAALGLVLLACLASFGLPAAQGTGASEKTGTLLVVNSLQDGASPPAGTTTLRAALERVKTGGKVVFDPALDGGTIVLTLVGSAHTILKGEVFPMGRFAGYELRDYGRSALYVRKNVTIDASELPRGITLAWGGGEANPARVLAVFGNLKLDNVTIKGGLAASEPLQEGTQPYTLGRGGGLAVWGTATLNRCTVAGNRVSGDLTASRDRGSFGGGIYANKLVLTDSVVSGNAVEGYGAAGGGIYSVGGAGISGPGSQLARSAVTGNRVTGQHAYGGGIYSDGGGPGNNKALEVHNCTIARNSVEDHPLLPQPPGSQYYYRGGGIYMSNGSLRVGGSTVVENAVTGIPAVFKGKPNMGGGGMAATIGDAHVVENMEIWHSIIAGNSVNQARDDVYSGSLLHFFSFGYNRIGKLNFSQILVPVPPWWSLSRKHWPKAGDQDGVLLEQAVDVGAAALHPSITSAGVDPGTPVVLWYPPSGSAVGQIPAKAYTVSFVLAQYQVRPRHTDGFLNRVLQRLRTDYAAVLGDDFGEEFPDMTGTAFSAVPDTWPSDPANAAWIKFWRDLDAAIAGRLGAAGLDDDFWGTLKVDPQQTGARMTRRTGSRTLRLAGTDQRRRERAVSGPGAIGAIED